jgi:hypothetical protein
LIGVILGKAFDRALTILIRRWWIFAIGCVTFDCIRLLGASYNWLTLPANVVWAVVAGNIVGHALRPNFRVHWSNVMRYLGASLVAVLILVGPFVAAAMTLQYVFLYDRAALLLLTYGLIFAGIVYTVCEIWLGTKLCLALTIAFYDGLTIGDCMRLSWKLVSGRFWEMFGFNLLMIGAVYALAKGPMFVSGILSTALHDPGNFSSSGLAARYLPIAFEPLAIYSGLAGWSAYLLCLDWLKSTSASAAPAAP